MIVSAHASFGPFYAYVIIRRRDGLAVGDAGFFGPPGGDGEVEIGYALVPSARGSALAVEAVALLAGWALDPARRSSTHCSRRGQQCGVVTVARPTWVRCRRPL
jgi:RimJ/RimL family protein N-acetyltransferase